MSKSRYNQMLSWAAQRKTLSMVCLCGVVLLVTCGAAQGSEDDWDAQISKLMKGINHKMGIVRWASALALGGIGPEAERAIPSLVEALEDNKVKVQCAAVRALGNMGSRAAVAIPELVKLQESEEEWLSREISTALKKIRDGGIQQARAADDFELPQ